mmetsp:Transcript_58465/g.128175  ORF Transcript_58465/g.128175 Transcript_58465/m.128175 type:complete len:295 (+) Transcript_58465:318-1202(+)
MLVGAPWKFRLRFLYLVVPLVWQAWKRRQGAARRVRQSRAVLVKNGRPGAAPGRPPGIRSLPAYSPLLQEHDITLPHPPSAIRIHNTVQRLSFLFAQTQMDAGLLELRGTDESVDAQSPSNSLEKFRHGAESLVHLGLEAREQLISLRIPLSQTQKTVAVVVEDLPDCCQLLLASPLQHLAEFQEFLPRHIVALIYVQSLPPGHAATLELTQDCSPEFLNSGRVIHNEKLVRRTPCIKKNAILTGQTLGTGQSEELKQHRRSAPSRCLESHFIQTALEPGEFDLLLAPRGARCL